MNGMQWLSDARLDAFTLHLAGVCGGSSSCWRESCLQGSPTALRNRLRCLAGNGGSPAILVAYERLREPPARAWCIGDLLEGCPTRRGGANVASGSNAGVGPSAQLGKHPWRLGSKSDRRTAGPHLRDRVVLGGWRSAPVPTPGWWMLDSYRLQHTGTSPLPDEWRVRVHNLAKRMASGVLSGSDVRKGNRIAGAHLPAADALCQVANQSAVLRALEKIGQFVRVAVQVV